MTPLLMTAEAARPILAEVAGMGLQSFALQSDPVAAALRLAARAASPPQALMSLGSPLPAEGVMRRGGLAILPLIGPLAPEPAASFWTGGFLSHGYDSLPGAIAQAAADPEVSAIVLWIDSPGGLVSGCQECAEAVRAARGGKPILAYARQATSAAYWIAAQADRIIAEPAAPIGSIGVYLAHLDQSGALAKAGLVVTEITGGPRKAEASPFRPLSEDVKAGLGADMDAIWTRFRAAVTAGRPSLAEARLVALGGAVVLAQHTNPGRSALALGLIDEIGGFAAVEAAARSRAAEALPAAQAPARATVPSQKGPKAMPHEPDWMSTVRRAAKAGDPRARAVLAAQAQAMADEPEAEEDMDEAEAEDMDETEAEDEYEDEAPAAARAKVKAKAKPAAAAPRLVTAAELAAMPEAKGREALALELVGEVSAAKARAILAGAPRADRRGAVVDHAVAPNPAAAAPATDTPESLWNASPAVRAQFSSKEAFMALAAREPGILKDLQKQAA